MASLGKDTGPYALDVVKVRHRNTVVTTIVDSPVFNNLLKNLDDIYEYEIGFIPAGYQHRPDLISNLFYGTPKNWWLLMLVNNISDPFEGFYLNQKIVIPKVK